MSYDSVPCSAGELSAAPSLLATTGNGLVLTDDGSGNQVLSCNATGYLQVLMASGGPFEVKRSSGDRVFRVDVFPNLGNETAIVSDLEDGDISATVRLWDANSSLFVGTLTNATIIGIGNSDWNFSPASSSSGTNHLYTMNLKGPQINNDNAAFGDVHTAFFGGPQRLITNVTTLALATTVEVECPVVGPDEQIGLYISQRAAEQTATTRYGIKIDAQNSGTNRYAIYAATDKCYLGGEVEIDGALNHDGTTVGFYGVAPVARSATYAPTNVTTDRAYDADTVLLAELADVVGTLISDLQLVGIIG